MGYRSDVTMVMYPKRKEDFAMLKLFVAENLPDEFEEHESDSGFRYLLLEFEGIKWYEGYEGVDVYTRAFSEWDDKFFDESEKQDEDNAGNYAPIFHYEFMRVGEEYEDVQYECSYGSDHALNLSREVYVDL
jgi:hypothetical protein